MFWSPSKALPEFHHLEPKFYLSQIYNSAICLAHINLSCAKYDSDTIVIPLAESESLVFYIIFFCYVSAT